MESAQAVHGETCLKCLEIGTPSSSDLMIGHLEVFLSAYSKPYQMTPIWSMRWWMRWLFPFTATVTAQKGGPKSGYWQVKRRMDNQNSSFNRCFRQFGSFLSATWEPLRYHRGRFFNRGYFFWGANCHKAFDVDWIIEEMNRRKAKIVISQRPQRKQPLKIDKEIYKWQHLIENFFCKIQDYKPIALPCEKQTETSLPSSVSVQI